MYSDGQVFYLSDMSYYTLMEVNSLTLHNLHYIVLALSKAARPAQIKEKIEILVL